MKILKKDKQGITLIELLVVLAIISILALIAYTSLSEAREEARKASLKAIMDSLAPAAEVYALKNKELGFSYENFCDSGIIVGIENSCEKVYGAGNCDCSICFESPITWGVTCYELIKGFSWTCEHDGITTYCHE